MILALRIAWRVLLIVGCIALFIWQPFVAVMVLNASGVYVIWKLPKCIHCKSRFWVRPTDLTAFGIPIFHCIGCEFSHGLESHFVRHTDEADLRKRLAQMERIKL